MNSTPEVTDFDEFLAWYTARRRRTKGRGPSVATLRTKRIYLTQAARILGAESPDVLGTLLSDRRKVEHLLDEWGVRLTPGTMQVAVYALLDFAEYAAHKGWPNSAVLRSDRPAKNPPPPITVYTEEEMAEFVAAARGIDLRFWALLAFLADTGRRISEALSLEWDWLKLEGDPPYFELPWQKNGNPQYIPLGSRLVNEVFTPANIRKLQESGRATLARDPKTYVFPMTYSSAHKRFGRFCERTGLPNRGFHNFRHTVITKRLIDGVPLQAVAALAGHANPNVTGQRYNHATALSYARYVE